jgi:phosphoribosylformylglycinamidine synthase
MAASAIDEAVRNCVAVGANPARIAILDNFCWGDCERPETLGSLVRAAIACHDVAVALGTPFISGKDSLNNEFSYEDASGTRRTIAIPPSLLISAIGQIDDVATAVSMDLKEDGDLLYLVGQTKDELGGSYYCSFELLEGGQVPTLDAALAREIYRAVHCAITAGLVRSCHDLSEGGLAIAATEMAFSGGLGVEIDLAFVPQTGGLPLATLLFSESNSRLLCEVTPAHAARFEELLRGIPHANVGCVTGDANVVFRQGDEPPVIEVPCDELKDAWKFAIRDTNEEFDD